MNRIESCIAKWTIVKFNLAQTCSEHLTRSNVLKTCHVQAKSRLLNGGGTEAFKCGLRDLLKEIRLCKTSMQPPHSWFCLGCEIVRKRDEDNCGEDHSLAFEMHSVHRTRLSISRSLTTAGPDKISTGPADTTTPIAAKVQIPDSMQGFETRVRWVGNSRPYLTGRLSSRSS